MSVKILFLPLLSLIMLCALLGCGGDDPIPGEEVVSDKWKDPEDIGKVYTVGEVKVGDTVTIADGTTHKVKEVDTFKTLEDGTTILSTVVGRQDENDPNFFGRMRLKKPLSLKVRRLLHLKYGTTATMRLFLSQKTIML